MQARPAKTGKYIPVFEIYRRLRCEHCAGMGVVPMYPDLEGQPINEPCEHCIGSGTAPIPPYELGFLIFTNWDS